MSHAIPTLSCSGVLEVLSDYLDGELESATRAAVEAHLAGCDNCTRFGGEFVTVVTALRRRLGEGERTAPGEAVARIDAALGPG